jgi:hypothetical protein
MLTVALDAREVQVGYDWLKAGELVAAGGTRCPLLARDVGADTGVGDKRRETARRARETRETRWLDARVIRGKMDFRMEAAAIAPAAGLKIGVRRSSIGEAIGSGGWPS